MNIGSDAVFKIVNLTLPHLREGLNAESATATVKAIYDVVGVSAVSICDAERVLAFVGEGADHHAVGGPILTHLTLETLNTGVVRAVRGQDAVGCPVSGCPLRSAIVAPLRSSRHIAGCLKFYNVSGGPFSKQEIEFAEGLAGMLSIELELAEIDIQKQLKAEAELQALQAQISPHFLFNTLNTIASYCRRDGIRAEELLVEFAELFRRNLKHHRGLVSLQEELDFVDSYLRFEQYRFGDRLRVERDHEWEALMARVPPLVLQPIVENAVAHGVTSRTGPSTVLIQSYVHGGDVIVAVQDDGVGMDPAILEEGRGDGIGLLNVKRRLEGLFGPEYGLSVSSPAGGGTRVELRVPRRAPRDFERSAGQADSVEAR
ncbi:MAG: histidine kinase [Thermoleophilia bacterium]|nr:histidine kinase [Thermoleophilia bacterium]